MNLRGKLIFLFVSIVALILVATSLAVYFFSAEYRRDEFYTRLESKATITARLLIEVDEVTPEVLKRIEANNPVSLPSEEMKIYNADDEILYTTDQEEVIRMDSELLGRVRREGEVKFVRGDYECLGFMYAASNGDFVVIVGATDIFGFNKKKNLRNVLFIVFGAAIFIILFSGYLYVGKAMEPISRVIKEVDDISATSLHRRLKEGNKKDEFSKLAHTFNSMLQRLELAFVTQKNFIANASHEIRNPLTAVLGQIDVSLLSTRAPEEYQRVLISIREDITNLKTVSNRLLLLAQASVEDVEKRFTTLRLDQLLWDAKAELNRLHPEYSIVIQMEDSIDDEEKLNVKGDEQLLKGAIINVLDNGCKYSNDHKVFVVMKNDSNKTILVVKDEGIGILKEDIPHLFEPFYRGKNAATFKGNGIGLSLVYRIIKSHFGEILIESIQDQGTTLTIQLPVAAT